MPRAPDGQERDDGLDPSANNLAESAEVENGAADDAISLRIPHGLSEREEQILRGLVKGQSNKLIARACDVAEATVKVHIKSILRKIRVANRTQAAIWGLGQGYGAHVRDRAPGRAAQARLDLSAVAGMAD